MAAIPIANIYYLLCYAWDEFAPGQLQRYAAEDFTDSLNLFSRQLIAGIQSLHKRGFETGYLTAEESTSILRGRILVQPSIRTMTTQPQKLYCTFDEMSLDIPSNQILKATATRLLGVESLDAPVRRELRQAAALLRGVREIALDASTFHAVRLHQNNRLYSYLLTICRFLYESMVAQNMPGQYYFREVDKDERRMRRIFEKFVRNFLKRRQMKYVVKSDRMDWFATADDGSDLSFLPTMSTDASLRSANRTIIIECKYTERIFRSRFGSEKLQSTHLYQLCAYLRNLERNGEPDKGAEGILLYPSVGKSLDQSYVIQGHRIRVHTLDLNQPWTGIEAQMLSLVESTW
jgi:5-methylcytosine-specific restriction enzyme subunit McrC